MDMKEAGKEPSEDVTRESLIAISYRVPDRTPEKSPENIAGEKVIEPVIRDEDEKYRAKLISLSSSPSPEMKELPVMPGQPHA